ncbi:MAG: prephenate dehydrogenase/arogenate dehydrogenase family protein [Actinomycetota bacterium]
MRRIAVVGTGLIGGSIGLAARAGDATLEVVGFDPDPQVLEHAVAVGALSTRATTATDAAADADLVVLCMPVDRIPSVLTELRAAVGDGAVITDVGSAKASIVALGEATFGDRFVGGHPMAGSERHGIEAAHQGLFEDAWWILTPTHQTSSRAYSVVSDLVARLGAKTVAVDPAAHDALVARLSHVPQLVASALVEMAVAAGDREALLGLAAGGFRDVTRIAASNPDLWVAIVRSNRGAVLEALGALGDQLTGVSGMISESRWDALRVWLDRSRSARMGLFAKPAFGGEPAALSLVIPDRPGVLAEVTTAAGRLGANIEDLRIIHSTEGGQGRLELVVAGEERAEVLADALRALGYRVERDVIE